MKNILDVDRSTWQNYVRHRHMATSLLFVMGGLTIIGYLFPYYGYLKENIWLHILRAGTQAGFIGGLADWFAVTALFRHPMGIPIPHTAILPMQKDRIGKGLGNFISDHVFTEDDIKQTLEKIDIPGILASSITEPDTIEAVTNVVYDSMPRMLDHVEEGRFSLLMGRIASRLFNGETTSSLISKILKALVNNKQHQEVLSFLLAVLKNSLKSKEDYFRNLIQERVYEQGGKVLGWMIGGSIATKVLVALNQEFDRIDPQDSDLREGFTLWVREEIDKIETDSERGKQIVDSLSAIITHESIQSWRNDIWKRVRDVVEEDMLNKEESWTATFTRDALNHIARQLREDQKLRNRVNGNINKMLIQSLPYLRRWLAQFTESVISSWDTEALTTRLECRVGKDLQYVRINGSLVGFIVGTILFVFLHLCFGSITG